MAEINIPMQSREVILSEDYFCDICDFCGTIKN